MAGQPDGKVAPKMVRESDLIAVKERERRIQTELAEAKVANTQLQNELKIARASGVDDEDVKAIQEMLLKKSQEVQSRIAEIEKRETSQKERERGSLVETLASKYSVDIDAIKDTDDPEKEALRLANERLNKERETPNPAENALETGSGSPPSKKSPMDMNPEELKSYETKIKAEWQAKHA